MALFRKHEGRQVLELPVDALAPNPNQPRKHFSQEELNELADSISQLGVMQPLTVRRRDRGWELIAGERRWRAAQLAGLSTVPCLEVSATDEASSLMALVENLQRKDLDFWEEALALRRLVDNYQLSQEEVARQVGKSQSAVANKLRLLKLPTDVLDSLRTAGLSERHARALLRLEGPELQRQAAAHVIRHQLTVARTEEYVERLTRPAKSRRPFPPLPHKGCAAVSQHHPAGAVHYELRRSSRSMWPPRDRSGDSAYHSNSQTGSSGILRTR